MEIELNSFASIPENTELQKEVSLLNEEINKLNHAMESATSPEDFQNLLNARQVAYLAIENANSYAIKKAIENIKGLKV